jgi:hypothetical protein
MLSFKVFALKLEGVAYTSLTTVLGQIAYRLASLTCLEIFFYLVQKFLHFHTDAAEVSILLPVVLCHWAMAPNGLRLCSGLVIKGQNVHLPIYCLKILVTNHQ